MSFDNLKIKVCNELNDSNQRCFVCNATISTFNQINNMIRRNINEHFLTYGFSALHANIRFMAAVLHISYRMTLKVPKDFNSTIIERKQAIQNSLRAEFGILVGWYGAGNTNNGNTARKFFNNIDVVGNATGKPSVTASTLSKKQKLQFSQVLASPKGNSTEFDNDLRKSPDSPKIGINRKRKLKMLWQYRNNADGNYYKMPGNHELSLDTSGMYTDEKIKRMGILQFKNTLNSNYFHNTNVQLGFKASSILDMKLSQLETKVTASPQKDAHVPATSSRAALTTTITRAIPAKTHSANLYCTNDEKEAEVPSTCFDVSTTAATIASAVPPIIAGILHGL
ncbi:hypothetical protein TSAR_008890 [Trichomalopsis sarcophagae]|uniref:Uncharacterized protein n=1 Tax=Trichomalopsis sarcophagae TaxID=543379 RepID=A0A232F333_9HYME|nr:hypothetical protein TSAR_008890 [Trichomalopsis sarcophagae]